MYNYVLGLKCGGLMEDPEWHIEEGTEVSGKDLKEAKDNWAAKIGRDKLETWNPGNQTVWGWNVVVLVTNDPNVPENEFYMYNNKINEKLKCIECNSEMKCENDVNDAGIRIDWNVCTKCGSKSEIIYGNNNKINKYHWERGK